MSSTKASSKNSGAGERRSDKPIAKNGEKPQAKKEKGEASEDRGQASQGVKRELQFYDVYVVKFETQRHGSDFHRSLLVEYTKEKGHDGFDVSKGRIFEVTGPTIIGNRSVFTFSCSQQVAPEDLQSFVRPKKKLGRVAADRVDRVMDVCSGVDPPSGPWWYTGRPDCNDWLNNVIARLHQQGIVEFDNDYVVPSREVSLIYDV